MYIHSEASQLDSISLDYQKILGNYLKNAIQKVEDKNLDYLCSFSVSINHFPIKNLLNHQQFPLALKLYLNIPETQKDLEKESILALGKAADSLAPDQHCLKFFKQFSQGILTSHPLFLASLGFYGADKSLIWDQFNTEKPFFIPELMVYQKGPNNFLIFNLLIKKDFYFSPDFKDRVLNKWLFLLDWVCSAKSLNHKVPNTAQLENSNYLISKKSFKNHVDSAKSYLSSFHKPAKVVVAHQETLKLDKTPNPYSLLGQLEERYPSCIQYIVFSDKMSFTKRNKMPKTFFLGASPETLFKRRGDEVFASAIGGSAPTLTKGQSSLNRKKKELEEHQFVIQGIKELLKPISYSFKSSNKPKLIELKNILHLFSHISAHINKGFSSQEILMLLHPTPALGGYPKEDSLKWLKNEEEKLKFTRGLYGGPIGYIKNNDDAFFAVAIRSGLFSFQNVHLFSGAGITSASDPNKEWHETLLKMKAIKNLFISP